MKKNLFWGIAAVLTCIHCAPSPSKPVADLMLVNGVFFTADARYPSVSAIAIAADTILALGDGSLISQYKSDKTQVIDLNGAFVMPGFIEGHGHFAGLGESLQLLNLLNTHSWQEIVKLTGEKVAQSATSDWVEGRGWHQEKWNEDPGPTVNGYPYHDALSAISPNNPVVLYHASGHCLMANAKAMQMAGISPETKDPPGGRIVRDAKGNPVGVFEENAMDLINVPFNSWKTKQQADQAQAIFEKTALLAAQKCLEHGITSFQDAGSNFWELEQYRRLAEKDKMPVRIWAMLGQPRNSELSQMAEFPLIGLGKRHFTCRAVKAYLDGALGSYGAWLLKPYDDKPDFTGQNTNPIDTLKLVAQSCAQYGMQLCVHAIGDRANREVLNVFENAAAGKTNLRWRIEHAQHIDPLDIPRFSKLGVIASMQAIHCTSDAPFVVKRLGTERARTGAYAWRSLLDAGAHLANGTDTPVEEVDPLPCIYAAVTRRRTDSGLEFFTEQKMTREEALLSYTLWNAYAAFEENEKGSLSPGKLADIVVLDKNLLTCVPEDILQAGVLKTIVGGKVLFSR